MVGSRTDYLAAVEGVAEELVVAVEYFDGFRLIHRDQFAKRLGRPAAAEITPIVVAYHEGKQLVFPIEVTIRPPSPLQVAMEAADRDARGSRRTRRNQGRGDRLQADGRGEAEYVLPPPDLDSPDGMAQALLWAMNNALPWDAPRQRAGAYVFRSKQELATVWGLHGGAPEDMPQVDFAREMVVAIFVDAGWYRTVFAIDSIRKEGSTMRVSCLRVSEPCAVKNPCSVIKVPSVEGDVVFDGLEPVQPEPGQHA